MEFHGNGCQDWGTVSLGSRYLALDGGRPYLYASAAAALISECQFPNVLLACIRGSSIQHVS